MPIDLDGTDLDWFAVDVDGHLAHFTSGGSRVVPAKVVASESDLERATVMLRALPMIGKAKICFRAPGIIDTWIDMAKRGLFSYDFISEDNNYFEKGHYRLIARPESPVRIESLDPLLQKALPSFRAPGLCFQKVDRVTQEMLKSMEGE